MEDINNYFINCLSPIALHQCRQSVDIFWGIMWRFVYIALDHASESGRFQPSCRKPCLQNVNCRKWCSMQKSTGPIHIRSFGPSRGCPCSGGVSQVKDTPSSHLANEIEGTPRSRRGQLNPCSFALTAYWHVYRVAGRGWRKTVIRRGWLTME